MIGGSLGGLTAALVLRDAGCNVTVYERSQMELAGLGAGIVVQEATVRYLIDRLGMRLQDISVAARVLQYLGRDGTVTFERPSPYRFTAWNTVYRALVGALGGDAYRRGHASSASTATEDGVDVRFANGHAERVDLLVCVDGVASTARKRLLPEVDPQYSGYVGWRGTVTESLLSPQTFAALSDAITYGLAPDSHIVAYQIPSVAGGMEEGERLVNFVWYRNVAAGAELDELMTDRDGMPRPLSLHPGIVQDRYVAAIRQTAKDVLSGPLAEMVVRTPQPFVQTIVDVEVPQMVFGRVCPDGRCRVHRAAACRSRHSEGGRERVGPGPCADGSGRRYRRGPGCVATWSTRAGSQPGCPRPRRRGALPIPRHVGPRGPGSALRAFRARAVATGRGHVRQRRAERARVASRSRRACDPTKRPPGKVGTQRACHSHPRSP